MNGVFRRILFLAMFDDMVSDALRFDRFDASGGEGWQF